MGASNGALDAGARHDVGNGAGRCKIGGEAAMLAGTGTNQLGPSINSANARAAIWMASSVGIFKSWAVLRVMISSGVFAR